MKSTKIRAQNVTIIFNILGSNVKSEPYSIFQYLLKRSGTAGGSSSSQNCDGYDELGCFHVRLYYDWFLIPGSCKCWKNDFFAQYTRK